MAFANERLTSLQRENFVKRGIKNPLSSNQILDPIFWTIDHERNACLINIGAYHDLPEEELFIFIFDSGIYMFTLQRCNISDTTKSWKFKKYKSLNDPNESNEEQLMTTFKEALLEYKYNGLPGEYKQQFKMEIDF